MTTTGDAVEPERDATPGRVVALDYGRRRLGVAASDPMALIASPHSSVERSGPPDRVPEPLLELLEELEPRTVVVGIPLDMDGSEGPMAREAQSFARALASRTGLPVVQWDERLSTVRAEREIRDMGVPKKKREAKGFSDMMAAAVILRGYLAAGGAG